VIVAGSAPRGMFALIIPRFSNRARILPERRRIGSPSVRFPISRSGGGCGWPRPRRAFSGAFLGNERDRAVDPDLEELVHIRHVRVGLDVLHIGAIAPKVGDDGFAILRAPAHFARQRQEFETLFKIEIRHRPSVRNGRAPRLLALLRSGPAELRIGAEAAVLQQDAGCRSGLSPSTLPSGGISLLPCAAAEGAGEAASQIVRAADEGAELAELQRELARACRSGHRGSTALAVRVVARRGTGTARARHSIASSTLANAQLLDVAPIAAENSRPEVAQEVLPRRARRPIRRSSFSSSAAVKSYST